MKKIKNKNEKKTLRVILPFIIIIIIIFLIAISLSYNISRFFARLGIGQIGIMAVQQNFIYTIPASQLSPGEVIGYYSFANDTSGNWNTTNTTPGAFRTFVVIYPENITSVFFSTLANPQTPISTIQLYNQFNVVVNHTNERTSSVARRIIVQVTDPNGKVISPSSSFSTDNSGQKGQITFSYTAEKLGTYIAQAFVWTEWASLSGFPIGYSITNTINSV